MDRMVVALVLLVIWSGIFFFLWRLDRKVKALEKKTVESDQ
ncbi:MAG: CcmD family protein [Bacteroidetes bacterium]|nr:CcmD family protein [Bacteroidota bacterium]